MTALHAPYYADNAVHFRSEVIANERIARDTFRLRFDCQAIAERIMPGQFVMVRIAGLNDPLIGRPFALYDVASDENGSRRYVDVGLPRARQAYFAGWRELRSGSHVEVWGPLGNGFLPEPCEHLIMVAGGIGQTPFLALAKEVLGTDGTVLRRARPIGRRR